MTVRELIAKLLEIAPNWDAEVDHKIPDYRDSYDEREEVTIVERDGGRIVLS